MKLSLEAVNSIIKNSKEYGQRNFGVMYGPDFHDFAKTVSGSDTVAADVLAHVLMVNLGTSELTKRAEALGVKRGEVSPKQHEDGFCRKVLDGTFVMSDYVAVLYLGYLIGQAEATIHAIPSSVQ